MQGIFFSAGIKTLHIVPLVKSSYEGNIFQRRNQGTEYCSISKVKECREYFSVQESWIWWIKSHATLTLMRGVSLQTCSALCLTVTQMCWLLKVHKLIYVLIYLNNVYRHIELKYCMYMENMSKNNHVQQLLFRDQSGYIKSLCHGICVLYSFGHGVNTLHAIIPNGFIWSHD